MWNLVAIFGNGTCALFVDRVGRRTFLLVGIAGCLVFLAIETAMVAKYVGTDNKAGNAAGGKSSLVDIQCNEREHQLTWSFNSLRSLRLHRLLQRRLRCHSVSIRRRDLPDVMALLRNGLLIARTMVGQVSNSSLARWQM